jgi:hypothetical protein
MKRLAEGGRLDPAGVQPVPFWMRVTKSSGVCHCMIMPTYTVYRKESNRKEYIPVYTHSCMVYTKYTLAHNGIYEYK